MRIVLFILSVFVLSTAACSKDKKAATLPQPEPAAPATAERTAPPASDSVEDDAAEAPEEAPEIELMNIYFAYDSALLDEQARDRVRNNTRWLEMNPDRKLRIEGHADERGTPEYNIALGMERARMVRDYMVQLGGESDRLETVSYGEERPVVAGKHERNRRVEFVPL